MIVQVPPDLAVEMWPVLAPMFKRCTVLTNGCYDTPDVLREILTGQQKLWVAWDEEKNRADAVVTTSIVTYPRRKVCGVIYIAGSRMRVWRDDMMATIERYARSVGATAVEGGGRPGWARAWPGMRPTGTLFFKDLPV